MHNSQLLDTPPHFRLNFLKHVDNSHHRIATYRHHLPSPYSYIAELDALDPPLLKHYVHFDRAKCQNTFMLYVLPVYKTSTLQMRTVKGRAAASK